MSNPPAPQSDVSFEAMSQRIWRHIDERDWNDSTPQSLAISIALEANELLEHYQWDSNAVGNKQELAEELADVFIYAFQFAHRYDIDIPAVIEDKLQKTAKKYPADKFKNANSEERRKNWYEAKQNHQKKGL